MNVGDPKEGKGGAADIDEDKNNKKGKRKRTQGDKNRTESSPGKKLKIAKAYVAKMEHTQNETDEESK